MSKSKIVALIIVVALVGGLCAYGFISSYSTLSDGDKGARIPIRLASFPESFDPASQQYDEDTMQFYSLIYSGLTRIDSDGDVKGLLADEWYGEYNERDEVYRIYFELNETYWSDGSRVSADDVVFAWKRILSPDFESPYASMLYPIMNAEEVKAGNMTSDDLKVAALDWNLLEVTIDPECYTESIDDRNGEYDADLFARIVASPAFTPLKEDVVTRNPDTWDVKATDLRTNGPFKVASIEQDVQIVLERNQFFMRDPDKEDDIPLDKYVLPHRLICYYGASDDSGKNAKLYEVSEFIDLYDKNDLFYLNAFDKETYEKYEVTTKEVMSTYAFFFNTNNATLADAEVRSALSAALDRKAIVDKLGTGQVAATGVVPHSVFYSDNKKTFREEVGEVISTSADTSKISSISGSGKFTISYLKSDEDPSAQIVAEYAAEVWSQYGFTVSTKGLNATEYERVLSTKPEYAEYTYDVIGVDLAMHCTDALSYLAQFSTVCSGGYISLEEGADSFAVHSTGLKDDAFDALVREAIYCGNAEKRAEIAKNIEQKLLELCPVAPIYFSTMSYTINDDLDKVEEWYGGYMDFDRAKLDGYLERNQKEDENK